jgi:hypothetical protein
MGRSPFRGLRYRDAAGGGLFSGDHSPLGIKPRIADAIGRDDMPLGIWEPGLPRRGGILEQDLEMHDATPYLRRVVLAVEIRVVPPDPALVTEQDGLPGIRRSQKRFDFLSRSTIYHRGDLIKRSLRGTDMAALRADEQQNKKTTVGILHRQSSKRAGGRAQTGRKLAGLRSAKVNEERSPCGSGIVAAWVFDDRNHGIDTIRRRRGLPVAGLFGIRLLRRREITLVVQALVHTFLLVERR